MKSPSRIYLRSPFFLLYLCLSAAWVVAFLPRTGTAQAESPLWRSIGPYGGSARAFAAVPGEPQHLYLGDAANWIFESLDGGVNWTRLRGGRRGRSGGPDRGQHRRR